MKKIGLLFSLVFLILALAVCASAEDVRYIADGGMGSGLSADMPMGSLSDAVKDLAIDGGKIVIVGGYTLTEPFFEPAHTGVITLTGGKLFFDHPSYPRYNMGGPLVLENITITRTEAGKQKKAIIAADFFDITIGKGVTCEDILLYIAGGPLTPVSAQVPKKFDDQDSHITIEGGVVESICGSYRGAGEIEHEGTAYITVKGGTVKYIYGGPINGCAGGNVDITVSGGTVTNLVGSGNAKNPSEGNLKVTVTGGTVSYLRTADSTDTYVGGNADITLKGGTISTLSVYNVFGHTTFRYLGGKVANYIQDLSTETPDKITDGKTSLIVGEGVRAAELVEQFDSAVNEDGSPISMESSYTVLDKVPEKSNATTARVYVSEMGRGTGLSPDSPISNLKDAYTMLDGVDGTIVLCGSVYVGGSHFYEPAHENKIIITSFDGERYFDGGLDVGSGNRFYFSGDTIIENTKLTYDKTLLMIGRYHNITLGTGIEMPPYVNGKNACYVAAGYQLPSSEEVPTNVGGTLTVESGSYYCVMGYSRGEIKDGDGIVYHGTQTLNLRGGDVARVYGGTVQYGSSDNIILNLDGTIVTDFIQLGGDQWYHSNTATVNVTAGSIKQLDLRNVLENVTVNWTGGSIDEMVVNHCIYNGARNEDAFLAAGEYKDTKFTLNYAGVTPTAEMLALFDTVGDAKAQQTVVKLTIGKAIGTVNGVEKALDAAPIIANSRTMLPVRFLAEAFGAEVKWDGATSTATITADGVKIAITIGAATAQINGATVTLDSPAFIENSRTYLPVRVIADALGAAVEWDGATSTATLTK